MSDYEKLEKAVAEYIEADNEGMSASGWVLTYQAVGLQADEEYDPLVSVADYTTGPGTTHALSLGLLRTAQLSIEGGE